ncbi:hypothetical protein VCRA213O314_220010 [Vibrio crassostreae]|nr:hypothetical protein VCRA213O314_220010 [Vibrio crassostreae]
MNSANAIGLLEAKTTPMVVKTQNIASQLNEWCQKIFSSLLTSECHKRADRAPIDNNKGILSG